LSEQWQSSRVPHVDGLIFSSGQVVLIHSATLRVGNSMKTSASAFAESTLASLMDYDEDPWVYVTELHSAPWHARTRLSCGEGAMGNEGFVAAIDKESKA